LLNLKTPIATEGPKFGLTAGDITAIEATCQAQIAKIDAYNIAAAALKTDQDGKATTDTALREEIADWKRADGWDDTIAASLRTIGSKPTVDLDNWKCEFTVRFVVGEIRIDWKKKGVQAVNVYGRLRGQTTWKFLARDTNSPSMDGTPLAQAGVSEVREYMLRGVVNDQKVGLDSDIQSITWGGN
jgi:hypothetical protein